MQIVVVDSATCGYGGLSWAELHALGQVEMHARTTVDQLHELVYSASCVLTNKVPFSRTMIESLPALKYIGVA